jgi:hypothetical protein
MLYPLSYEDGGWRIPGRKLDVGVKTAPRSRELAP